MIYLCFCETMIQDTSLFSVRPVSPRFLTGLCEAASLVSFLIPPALTHTPIREPKLEFREPKLGARVEFKVYDVPSVMYVTNKFSKTDGRNTNKI